jgi:hypothetical protein
VDAVPGEAFQVGDFCADVEVEVALVVFGAVNESGWLLALLWKGERGNKLN